MNLMKNSVLRRKHLLAVVLAVAALLLLLPVHVLAQDFSFTAMSDTQGAKSGVNETVASALVDHMVKNHPDVRFMLFTGDMVNGSRDLGGELARWKEIMAPIYNNPRMVWPKIWPAIGNHEVKYEGALEEYLQAFQDVYFNGPASEKGLTYSFDYDGVHFAAITTDRWVSEEPGVKREKLERRALTRGIRPETLAWLDRDLGEARKRGVRHIVVFGHQPAFPIGKHINDSLPMAQWTLKNPGDRRFIESRDAFWNILKRHKVSVYICGHEHCYGRQSVDGVYQIVLGSGGGALSDLNPTYDDYVSGRLSSTLYQDLIPYFEVLGYHFGPGEKSQASRDFVGGKYFQYVVFKVTKDDISVYAYGASPRASLEKGKPTEMDDRGIRLVDEFKIK